MRNVSNLSAPYLNHCRHTHSARTPQEKACVIPIDRGTTRYRSYKILKLRDTESAGYLIYGILNLKVTESEIGMGTAREYIFCVFSEHMHT